MVLTTGAVGNFRDKRAYSGFSGSQETYLRGNSWGGPAWSTPFALPRSRRRRFRYGRASTMPSTRPRWRISSARQEREAVARGLVLVGFPVRGRDGSIIRAAML
jgi:hypothetical protein